MKIWFTYCEFMSDNVAWHIAWDGESDAARAALRNIIQQASPYAREWHRDGSYVVAHNLLIALLPFISNWQEFHIDPMPARRGSIAWPRPTRASNKTTQRVQH